MIETTTLEVPTELLAPLADVFRHYIHAKTKHPEFPTDLVYQGSLVVEEVGEMQKEINNGNIGLARHELGQTVAVGLRMLIHLQHQ